MTGVQTCALPIFYVRTDRIKSPADLKGKRIGLPEYQLTACVWARIILEDDHGIKPSDVTWVRGGIDDPTRPEKITIKLPPGVRMENAPEGRTISELLESGEIDAFIAPRVPSLAGKRHPNIGWLFPDPIAAGRDYYKRTGIFPIMHVTGIRRARYPGLAKTRLEHNVAAAAINLIRLDAWWTGRPLDRTRITHLQRLDLAA